ncbi:unnamed protein product [Peniophora sp. CBMAI 1063]|nr:unnamed protein product [Peniophora sp. CBMAI 1063]
MEIKGGIAVLRLQPRTTRIRPCSTVGKDETVTSEFKDANVDFYAQMGQHRGNYTRRLMLSGGDGLTYDKFLQLKMYLQMHPDELESFEIMQPTLEMFHLQTTDVNRVYDVHWGEGLTEPDPSKIGHSAAKITRKPPFERTGKTDYYPARDLLDLISATRMLDCWRIIFGTPDDLWVHVEELERSACLLSFEDLYNLAHTLHLRYSSHRAFTRASRGDFGTNTDLHVAVGELPTGVNAPRGLHSWRTSLSASTTYRGDRVLAHAGRLILDGIMSREMAMATAYGDPGRLYEMVKFKHVEFGGSTHKNYFRYGSEFISDIEYDSHPPLQKTIKQNMLVNPKGKEDTHIECDLLQEHLNDDYQTILKRGNNEWDNNFARNVVAPNIVRLADTKKTYGEALELKTVSGKHPSPHTRPEVGTLMVAYRESNLHLYVPGRTYQNPDTEDRVDCFGLGQKHMLGGAIERWAESTSRGRGLRDKQCRDEQEHWARRAEEDLPNQSTTDSTPPVINDDVLDGEPERASSLGPNRVLHVNENETHHNEKNAELGDYSSSSEEDSNSEESDQEKEYQ